MGAEYRFAADTWKEEVKVQELCQIFYWWTAQNISTKKLDSASIGRAADFHFPWHEWRLLLSSITFRSTKLIKQKPIYIYSCVDVPVRRKQSKSNLHPTTNQETSTHQDVCNNKQTKICVHPNNAFPFQAMFCSLLASSLQLFQVSTN